MATRVACMVIGRRWNMNEPHVLHQLMMNHVMPMAEAEGFTLEYPHWEKEQIDQPCIVMTPGFNLPGGKYVKRTMALLQQFALTGQKVVFFTGDIESLKTWNSAVKKLKLPHGMWTSFQRPWKMWNAGCLFHEISTYYDPSVLRTELGPKQPKHAVGYVGWPKPARMAKLRKIGYESLIMCGFGADKQTDFPFICPENCVYPYLPELYKLFAWHVNVSDKNMILVRGAPCRPMEAWACGRPCAFHKSMVESRPELDWSEMEPWIFETHIELHKITRGGLLPSGEYDVATLNHIATLQRIRLGTQYFDVAPEFHNVAMWFSGRDDYGCTS